MLTEWCVAFQLTVAMLRNSFTPEITESRLLSYSHLDKIKLAGGSGWPSLAWPRITDNLVYSKTLLS